MRNPLSLPVLAALALVLLVGCSPDANDPGGGAPGSSPGDALGAYDGLCGWASANDVERLFGGPVVTTGGRECRIAAEGDYSRTGVFHFVLEQTAGFDQLRDEARVSATRGGFTICGGEVVESGGMRVQRMLTCPGETQDGWDFKVLLELGDGRVLASEPQEHPDAASAEEASRRFVELLQEYAANMVGLPLVNEVSPGAWLELYNPGTEPVAVGGWTVRAADRRIAADAGEHAVTVEGGEQVPPGGFLVVDLTGLEPVAGDAPTIELRNADGLWVDEVSVGSVGPAEVIRRNGDGQPFCHFATDGPTRGTSNPVAAGTC